METAIQIQYLEYIRELNSVNLNSKAVATAVFGSFVFCQDSVEFTVALYSVPNLIPILVDRISLAKICDQTKIKAATPTHTQTSLHTQTFCIYISQHFSMHFQFSRARSAFTKITMLIIRYNHSVKPFSKDRRSFCYS